MIEELAQPRRLARRLRAVLFVDVVDSVRLIQQDAEGTVNRWRDFVAAVNADDLPRAGGRMVKHTGDGMLVEFDSVVQAVETALAMQARIERGNEGVPADRQIHLRAGAHLADVMADEHDLYGDGVNLAARLMVLAGPQEIVVSAAVRDQLADGLGVTIEDLGERRLKGIERPVRAFRAWPPGPPPALSRDRTRRGGDRPSIAVLPFRNLSRDAAHEFLGDMIAEDLIGDLSRLTDLFVISRLSTTPFRDRIYEPRNVAEALGVRYVLSGNMQSSGSRLRLMAELTEAEIGQVIWAERFEGAQDDLFDLQDQLSRDITQRVVPHLRQRELRRARAARPENLTAYERTLRAIDHLHRTSRHDLEEAKSLLEAAIASDPAYGTAHAWLARWHVLRVGQGWSPDRAADAAAANRHAEIALELDDMDWWALSVHGLVTGYLNKDLEAAIAIYDRALTINPSAASAWVWSTAAYAWLDRGEEAVHRSHRAIELSPFDPHMYVFLSLAGTAHAVVGRYDTAVDLCQRSMRKNRMYLTTHRILVISLALAGRADEARTAAAELLTLEPELTVRRFRERYPGSASEHARSFCDALAAAGIPA